MTLPVVVVGAGPTGITAAALLADAGIECLVLDRWPDVYPQPRAVHLDDEVYRILGRLGVADDFAAISRPAKGLRLLDRRHRVLAEFDRDKPVGVHGFPQANMFDQPELEEVLRASLKHRPLVTLRGGCEVISVEQLETSVRVGFTVGTDTEYVEAAYLLGCDGANSLVRTAIGAEVEDLGFEQRWLVIDVETGLELDTWEGVHQICDADRAGTYMRIGETRYRWEFRLHDDESTATFQEGDGLAELLAPWLRMGDDPDLQVRRMTEYTFRAMVADHWRDRRVFLLGDAAHLTPPFIGQGMGAGLRDAQNLTWKLAGVLDGSLDDAWLDTYEPERKPHARELIRVAMGMGVAMTSGGRTGDLIRGVVLPRIHLMPGLRAKVLDSASPRLRCASRRQLLRSRLVGRLCPNARLSDGSRYDDVAGGRFAVVTAAAPSADHARRVEDTGAVLVPATGTPLGEWLAAGRTRTAVVRPDGTVLSTHADLDGACEALAAVKRSPRRTASARRPA
jgi:3-(3-hydroxy-phenyl)propionate hydroxylase